MTEQPDRVGYTTLSDWLRALVVCNAKGIDVGGGLQFARDHAAALEAELAETRQALLINSMHIAFLVAEGKPDEYYMQVALDQAHAEAADAPDDSPDERKDDE